MSSLPEDSRRTSLPSDEMLEFFRALEEEPYNYGLFATLRRLECSSKDTPRLGQSVKPSEDSVRIGQEPTLIHDLVNPIASFGCDSIPRPCIYLGYQWQRIVFRANLL